MMELEQAAGTNLYVQPSEEEGRILMTKLPVGFYLSPLPAKAPYFNNSHAIERAIMYRNAIYARADMDPEVAYAIIKAVDENRAEWENISPIAPDWGTIYEYAPPYHEGVVRYYREKGIWQGRRWNSTKSCSGPSTRKSSFLIRGGYARPAQEFSMPPMIDPEKMREVRHMRGYLPSGSLRAQARQGRNSRRALPR